MITVATGKKLLFRALMSGGESPNRRLAAYLLDRGVACQPSGYSKRRHLGAVFARRGHRVFIESGTYRGDTVAYFAHRAERVISVELDPALYRHSSARFAGVPNVAIILGNAVDVLADAVPTVGSPPLVWLDGHFSGGTTAQGTEIEPAPRLLRLLGPVSPPGTTVVVDDLRLFGATPGYPGLDELVWAAREAFPTARMVAAFDSLVIEV